MATAAVVGRIVAPYPPAIAYDPGTGLLIVTHADDDRPPVRVAAYRADAGGLKLVAELRNPDVGLVGVEPTRDGFIQLGQYSLLVWSAVR